MKHKQVTFAIFAKLEQSGHQRVVINGYYLTQMQQTFFGRTKYKTIGWYQSSAEAIKSLNTKLGFKES